MQENGRYRTLDDEIDSVILSKRRIFFSQAVDNDTAHEVIRKIWYLDMLEQKPILFVINSPGGSIDSGFAIWDQVKMLQSPVHTLVTGLAASMGSVLSLCAPKNKRFATKFARFMIHQPRVSGLIQGQAKDLEIHARQIIKLRNILVDLYMEETKRGREEIEQAIDRDTWMDAEEAKKFGLIEKVVNSYAEVM